MVADLVRLRYDTLSTRFGNAKNNAAIGEAWLLLATEMSRLQDKVISMEQCKNKIVWLKRKWAEYYSDMRATGNLEIPVSEPPGLVLMMEYWSSSSGMNEQALADTEVDADDYVQNANHDVSDEAPSNMPPPSKRRKTMADSFELGMKSMTDSFQAMAAAMYSPTVPTSSEDIAGVIDHCLEELMKREEVQLAQMLMQTHYMAQLIAKLEGNNDKQ
ncbi:hypothetical protein PR001_g2947 [Phytophthora rubi]|uniref:Myb/SANT-like domain-containing protein n=1 Tax=Phytophthora rubi TaxID=129364 RepID=A0A6A3P3P3_9STRA|nr:hypothetical protein PR001_g2947 [Phytophthora rubi]